MKETALSMNRNVETVEGNPPSRKFWRISDYSSVATASDWTDHERYRILVAGLPRRFHAASHTRQIYALTEPPPLTGMKWDALLAAVAEHIAIIHDHPIPDWCDEPERFLRIPWHPILIGGKGLVRAWVDSPGAFVRHGTFIDPRDLDRRGGERDYGCLL